MSRKVRSQAGFTLVELMITLVISLAILAGLSQAFVAGNEAYSVQDRMGSLQESGRYALYFLQRDIRMAGYPATDATLIPFPTTGSANAIVSEGTGNNASDQIAIQYRVDTIGGASDCVGTNVASGNILNNTYAVSRDATTNLSRLTCNGQPIVEGIEAMQILYGVDNDTDPGNASFGIADKFVPASGVASTEWQSKVVAVRIALLASTVTAVFGDKAADSTTSFALLDNTLTSPLASGVRGKVFTATIQLRNRAAITVTTTSSSSP